MSKIIGIDLGTTNSAVAVMEGGEAEVITNAEGNRTTPSVVAFAKDGEQLVGQAARRQAVMNPENTLTSIKRFMGRRYEEVGEEERLVPYHVSATSSNDCQVTAQGKSYRPPEIAAKILQKLKQDAERHLGTEVTQAVITVPAYFNDSQRQATKDAARIAGLEALRIINEPTAAALAYGLDKKKDEKVAVFDLGGGTFDVSILEIGDGSFEVLSTSGDTHLGGDDFDQRLIDWLADEFKKEQGIDLRTDATALQRLKESAEKAKCELSSSVQTDINLPFITADAAGPKHLNVTLTRAQLDQLVEELLERTKAPCMQALSDAGLSAEEIDEVVLVGGMTRMPAVVALVEAIFGKTPHQGVNPDEVVAVGAAVQAGVLSGEVDDVLLLDITPLSLGVETLGGVTTRLIDRNTTIPVSKKEVFSTAEDGQSVVTVHVLQGEREFAKDNRSLGRFNLEGVAVAQRGTPQIEVAFDIDANGIVHVSAKDLGTGKEQSIRIESSSGLSESEIEQMVADADSHASEDKKHREEVELHNSADALAYSTEKFIEEHGPTVNPAERENLEAGLSELRTALEGSDADALRTAMENVTRLSQAATQAMQNEAAQAATQSEAPAAESENSDAVDADFTVVDEPEASESTA